MRRLQVLPCPESWDRMRTDGDGRFCERCRLHVTDVASLDADGLERMLAAAADGPVCARFELERGQPRIKLGMAAGLVVMALAGCAGPQTNFSVDPAEARLMGAMVVERPMIDTTSASSTYSSRMIEYR